MWITSLGLGWRIALVEAIKVHSDTSISSGSKLASIPNEINFKAPLWY